VKTLPRFTPRKRLHSSNNRITGALEAISVRRQRILCPFPRTVTVPSHHLKSLVLMFIASDSLISEYQSNEIKALSLSQRRCSVSTRNCPLLIAGNIFSLVRGLATVFIGLSVR